MLRIVSAVLLALGLSVSQALACTFHQTGVGSFFEVTYPGSLKVAAATAQARAEGRLAKARLGRGLFGLARASGAMNSLGDRFDLAPQSATTDFFVILAGQQLWTEYRLVETDGTKAYRVQVHADAPRDDATVVVTSYDVVVALLAGTLTMDEAVDENLVQIRGDESGRVAAFFGQALLVEQAARQE